MDFSSPEKALHFIIPFFCGIFNKKAIGIRKNKKISTQKTTEKTALPWNFPETDGWICLNFAINKKSKDDTQNTGDGKTYRKSELQCQHAQIQHQRRGKPEAFAITEPTQGRVTAQKLCQKSAQHNASQQQQYQNPNVL